MPPRSRRRQKSPRAQRAIFDRRNYQLLALSLALVAVGFTLMRLENEVDGFLSLYVSPLMIVAGYLGVIYSILWRPRTSAEGPVADTES
jgi:hypothetical protein